MSVAAFRWRDTSLQEPGNPHVCFVFGATRSGKSRFAEQLVTQTGLERVYIATAVAGDAEMSERIARHRSRRGDDWITIEEPVEIERVLRAAMAECDRVALVDCLTIWLANLMATDHGIDHYTTSLLRHLAEIRTPIVLVSNEVGSGIVPDNALARTFRDDLGTLNRRVAEIAGRVVLVSAGIPLTLKDSS